MPPKPARLIQPLESDPKGLFTLEKIKEKFEQKPAKAHIKLHGVGYKKLIKDAHMKQFLQYIQGKF